MWKIKQIFDGDYGCEELAPGVQPKLSITLENELGEKKYVTASDEWITKNYLDEGDVWPEGVEDKENF